MSNKEIFSKIIPNIKLTTRLDAEGKEIAVEIRQDSEATECRKKILDLLLSAGYFRVMIKNLSDFDKIVGGMTWCMEACEQNVDIDLLFNENLMIGQKIALTENVVTVLPQMKCPFNLEPHQIQGLDFVSIFPVIQWLVKESVKLRSEKAERLKLFAVGQFHNHFEMTSSERERIERENSMRILKKAEDFYAARRQYKRKQHNYEPEDESSRVRLTLLEYGIKTISKSISRRNQHQRAQSIEANEEMEMQEDEIDMEQLMNDNLALAKEEIYQNVDLTEEQKTEIMKHYENLKLEILIDAKQLSEQNKIKTLEAMETALEKRLQRVLKENENLSSEIKLEGDKHEALKLENDTLCEQIQRLEIQEKDADEDVKNEIKELIIQNEKMKQAEVAFKEECKRVIEELHVKIEEAETLAATPDSDVTEQDHAIDQQSENLRICRLQLAKKNRAVTSLQRQIDNIPDNIELGQYTKRFFELYSQMSKKHKETKQLYAQYNTLNDTHLYIEKELTLLNSIYDNYNQAMLTISSKEQFLSKFQEILDGVSKMKGKIQTKCDNERSKRNELNSELLSLIELQRKYAAAIKQFKLAFQNC